MSVLARLVWAQGPSILRSLAVEFQQQQRHGLADAGSHRAWLPSLLHHAQAHTAAAASEDGSRKHGDAASAEDGTASIDAEGAYYRTPYHPPSRDDGDVGQRRATGRLEMAIEGALLADAVIREQLVERLGFVVHRVRLSSDRRRAHVLWDSHPGAAAACEAGLQRCAYRMRQHIAKVLRARNTPYLEFKHDHLPQRQACVAAAIERVEREQQAEEESGCSSQHAHRPHSQQQQQQDSNGEARVEQAHSQYPDSDSGATAWREASQSSSVDVAREDGSADVVDAAIDDLLSRMAPKRRHGSKLTSVNPDQASS